MRETVWKKLYTGVFGVVGVAFFVLTAWLLFWLFGPLTHAPAPPPLEQAQTQTEVEPAAAKAQAQNKAKQSPPKLASKPKPQQPAPAKAVTSAPEKQAPSEPVAESQAAGSNRGQTEQASPSEALAETRILYFEAYASEASLDPKMRNYLDKVKAYLKDSPGWQLAVVGHSDSSGSREVNIDVARERAQTVARQLQKYGFAEKDLQVDSKGPDEPLVSNDSAEGRAKNRRVELHLITR